MKHASILSIAALLILFASSCTVEKRRYMSGYHIEWNHHRPEGTALQAAPAQAAPQEEELASLPVLAPEQKVEQASVAEGSTAHVVAVEEGQKAQRIFQTPSAPARSGRVSPGKLQAPAHASRIAGRPAAQASLAWQDFGASYDTVLLIILAFLIPPLAVYLHQGSWNGTCWLNLLLTLLFWLPGFIHALIVILG